MGEVVEGCPAEVGEVVEVCFAEVSVAVEGCPAEVGEVVEGRFAEVCFIVEGRLGKVRTSVELCARKITFLNREFIEGIENVGLAEIEIKVTPSTGYITFLFI